MRNRTSMYYFCKDAENQFIKSADYLRRPNETRQKYRPATFEDVRLHGSDELKKEIEPIKQTSMRHSLLFGALK